MCYVPSSWKMSLSFCLGNCGMRQGNQTVELRGPSNCCWRSDNCSLIWQQRGRILLIKYAVQSRTRNVENVAWNRILKILPRFALRSVTGLSWIQCKIFFFLKDISPLLWLDKTHMKMTRMDRCSIYFYISVGKKNVRKLFNLNLNVISVFLFFLPVNNFLKNDTGYHRLTQFSAEWLLLGVNSSWGPRQLDLTREELFCLTCLLIPQFRITFTPGNLVFISCWFFFFPFVIIRTY